MVAVHAALSRRVAGRLRRIDDARLGARHRRAAHGRARRARASTRRSSTQLADEAAGQGSTCFLVARRAGGAGALLERRRRRTSQEVFSVTKSVTSTLVGLAQADGDLSVDDPASTYIPSWQGTPSGAVTVRNLLSNDSGRFWSPESDYRDLIQAQDRTAYAVGLDAAGRPGHRSGPTTTPPSRPSTRCCGGAPGRTRRRSPPSGCSARSGMDAHPDDRGRQRPLDQRLLRPAVDLPGPGSVRAARSPRAATGTASSCCPEPGCAMRSAAVAASSTRRTACSGGSTARAPSSPGPPGECRPAGAGSAGGPVRRAGLRQVRWCWSTRAATPWWSGWQRPEDAGAAGYHVADAARVITQAHGRARGSEVLDPLEDRAGGHRAAGAHRDQRRRLRRGARARAGRW